MSMLIVFYVHLGLHMRLVVVAVGDLLFCCSITLWLFICHVLSFFSYYVLWAMLPDLNKCMNEMNILLPGYPRQAYIEALASSVIPLRLRTSLRLVYVKVH